MTQIPITMLSHLVTNHLRQEANKHFKLDVSSSIYFVLTDSDHDSFDIYSSTLVLGLLAPDHVRVILAQWDSMLSYNDDGEACFDDPHHTIELFQRFIRENPVFVAEMKRHLKDSSDAGVYQAFLALKRSAMVTSLIE